MDYRRVRWSSLLGRKGCGITTEEEGEGVGLKPALSGLKLFWGSGNPASGHNMFMMEMVL